ncbi:MAG: endo-1,4-beta-xylanase [Clostridia bacterium]|nr:endo-1,4-beta-xylanase [Clostridia bacterium]
MSNYECRKASRAVRVRDAEGRPVVNATLRLEQTEHDFLFGSGAFDAISFTNEKKGDPFWKDRMDKWLNLFNYGTMSFYWGAYEPEEGKPAFESRMNASKFLTERGKKVKGHPLCWHSVCADWLMQYDNKTIFDKQLARIHRDVSAFAGVIDLWDVINEVVIMPVYDRYDNAVTRICKQYGQLTLVKEVFEAAKAANPNALLLINDFNLSEKYAELIERCLDAGVPIGAIGLQTHQHQGYMGEARLTEVLRRFERFGLPLHFTENTLVSGHLMPPEIVDLNDYQIPEWPTTPEGEARQAREWEEMYRILFAHPLVEAVTGWDFADGMWLGAPSGIITADNRVKPAYRAIERLKYQEWHTACDVHTDGEGVATVSGFKGSYSLSGDGRRGAFHLAAGADPLDVILS